MKYQILILSVLVFVSLSGDCNNPLIDADMVGILKTPVVADKNLKFCPDLAGKEICCDVSAMTNFVTKMKAKNRRFEKKRQKQVKSADDAIKDDEANIDVDAEMEATQDELGQETI